MSAERSPEEQWEAVKEDEGKRICRPTVADFTDSQGCGLLKAVLSVAAVLFYNTETPSSYYPLLVGHSPKVRWTFAASSPSQNRVGRPPFQFRTNSCKKPTSSPTPGRKNKATMGGKVNT